MKLGIPVEPSNINQFISCIRITYILQIDRIGKTNE